MLGKDYFAATGEQRRQATEVLPRMDVSVDDMGPEAAQRPNGAPQRADVASAATSALYHTNPEPLLLILTQPCRIDADDGDFRLLVGGSDGEIAHEGLGPAFVEIPHDVDHAKRLRRPIPHDQYCASVPSILARRTDTENSHSASGSKSIEAARSHTTSPQTWAIDRPASAARRPPSAWVIGRLQPIHCMIGGSAVSGR